jgi:hypothetical protein
MVTGFGRSNPGWRLFMFTFQRAQTWSYHESNATVQTARKHTAGRMFDQTLRLAKAPFIESSESVKRTSECCLHLARSFLSVLKTLSEHGNEVTAAVLA